MKFTVSLANAIHTLSVLYGYVSKESRWGRSHMRNDFPERDDSNWLKHVIVSKEFDKSDVAISYKPIWTNREMRT